MNEQIKIGLEVHVDALRRELENLKNGSHIKCSTESKEEVENYISKIEKELSDLESKNN